MDAVLAHPAAAHDHQIPRVDGLFFGRFTVNGGRHDSQSSDIDQALAHVAGVKQNLPAGRGNAAFVTPVANPFNDTVQEPSRVQTGPQISIIIARSHTETVAAHDQA